MTEDDGRNSGVPSGGGGPRGIARQIADQIRAAVTDGSLQPGDRLPAEHELAASFNVARGTVREALRTLGASGLVRSARGSRGGTFVTVPDAETVAAQLGESLALWFDVGNISLADVNEARAVLERECVRSAALKRTEDDLTEMRRAIELSRSLDLSDNEFITADVDFHTAVSNAAKNEILGLAMAAVHLVRPRTNRLLLHNLDRATIANQHWAMYEGIRDKDPERAVIAFHAHIEHLHTLQRAALADSDPRRIPIADVDFSVTNRWKTSAFTGRDRPPTP